MTPILQYQGTSILPIETMTRVELASSAWQANALAAVLHRQNKFVFYNRITKPKSPHLRLGDSLTLLVFVRDYPRYVEPQISFGVTGDGFEPSCYPRS